MASLMRSLIMPFLAAALVAAAPPLPEVKPHDDTANFQGSGGRVVFDPACRDYTVETLPSDPACAARVAAGETAPSLAIAASTAVLPGPRRVEAIAILERAIAKHDHPAAHYLLGMFLGTGELFTPDYARAAKHLEIASTGGNPSAADLLATLIVEGKGTPRDLPRAERLYRQAIAAGYPESATSLAILYLNGRYLPRDAEFGRRLLEAAAAAGDARAKQLAPLAGAADKFHNFQILPAEADGAVKVREYGAFDNPQIPPGYGFDDAFQAVHYAPYDDAATLAVLERDVARLPTPYRYELARRVAVRDPARALELYLLARTVMTYDALRCADAGALEAVRAWDIVTVPDMRFALKPANPETLAAAAKAALAAESALAGDTRPWWVCRAGMPAMTAAMAGKPLPLALKPAAEWPALRAQSRQPIAALVR